MIDDTMIDDTRSKRQSFLSSIIVSSIILFTLTACAQPVTHPPAASQEERHAEEARQQRMVDAAAEKGGVARPWRNRPRMRKSFDQTAERIEEAGAALCQAMGLPKRKLRCYYYFDTSRSLELNAFTDGKYIIITKGMQRFLENDDELAGVMAHELAHALMAHIDAQRNNALAGGVLGLALDAAAASQGVSTGGDFAGLGVETGRLRYSEAFEAEADYIGLYIAARAGYDIARIPAIWERLSLEEPDGIYTSTTHPSNAERFVAMQKIITEIDFKRKKGMALVPELR